MDDKQVQKIRQAISDGTNLDLDWVDNIGEVDANIDFATATRETTQTPHGDDEYQQAIDEYGNIAEALLKTKGPQDQEKARTLAVQIIEARKKWKALHRKYTPAYFKVISDREENKPSEPKIIEEAKKFIQDRKFVAETELLRLQEQAENTKEKEDNTDEEAFSLLGSLEDAQTRIRVYNNILNILEYSPEPDKAPLVVDEVDDEIPQYILSIPADNDKDKRRGSFLQKGQTSILAGAGGGGKTTVVTQLAVDMASAPEGQDTPVLDGALISRGGKILYVTLEDDPSSIKKKIVKYIDSRPEIRELKDALKRIYILPLRGRPLFGPPLGRDNRRLTNSEPEPRDAGTALWRHVEKIKPIMVIIDPVLGAYIADLNNADGVRKFMMWLSVMAEEHDTCVLLIAHSNKDNRMKYEEAYKTIYSPGNVGGTTQWFDAARGVLSLTTIREKGKEKNQDEKKIILGMVKANYGPDYHYTTLLPNVDEHSGVYYGVSWFDEVWNFGEHPNPNPTKKKDNPKKDEALPAVVNDEGIDEDDDEDIPFGYSEPIT